MSDYEKTTVNIKTPTSIPNQTIGNLAKIDNSARVSEQNAPVV